MTFAKGKLPVTLSTLAPEALGLCRSGGSQKAQHQEGPRDHGIAKVFTQWTVCQGFGRSVDSWLHFEVGRGWFLLAWSSWRPFSSCQKLWANTKKRQVINIYIYIYIRYTDHLRNHHQQTTSSCFDLHFGFFLGGEGFWIYKVGIVWQAFCFLEIEMFFVGKKAPIKTRGPIWVLWYLLS